MASAERNTDLQSGRQGMSPREAVKLLGVLARTGREGHDAEWLHFVGEVLNLPGWYIPRPPKRFSGRAPGDGTLGQERTPAATSRRRPNAKRCGWDSQRTGTTAPSLGCPPQISRVGEHSRVGRRSCVLIMPTNGAG